MNIGRYEGDVSKLTKESATVIFSQCVAEIQWQLGYTFDRAWASARELNPELFTTVTNGQGPASQVISASALSATKVSDSTSPGSLDSTGGVYSAKRGPASAPQHPFRVAVPNDANLERLGLPRDCSYEEFSAANKANGDADPRDSFSIFQALISLIASSGINPEAAEKAARDRFPDLAEESDMASGKSGKAALGNSKRTVLSCGPYQQISQ